MSELDPWDKALLAALDDSTERTLVTLDGLAESSGLSTSVLEVLVREGLLTARRVGPPAMFDPADATAIAAGLEMVGAGLPMAELLDLARRMDEAMRPIADRAVEVFERFVRDSVAATADDEEAATERLITAFRTMLPATGRLVDHHFRRLIVDRARARLEDA